MLSFKLQSLLISTAFFIAAIVPFFSVYSAPVTIQGTLINLETQEYVLLTPIYGGGDGLIYSNSPSFNGEVAISFSQKNLAVTYTGIIAILPENTKLSNDQAEELGKAPGKFLFVARAIQEFHALEGWQTGKFQLIAKLDGISFLKKRDKFTAMRIHAPVAPFANTVNVVATTPPKRQLVNRKFSMNNAKFAQDIKAFLNSNNLDGLLAH